ncbi:hypothetical protein GOP80_06910 [Planococcaceae bacterium Storch 2/2-2]|nr:hypothetical protein [Planococcaceae bacterium Storch 2/2-2]
MKKWLVVLLVSSAALYGWFASERMEEEGTLRLVNEAHLIPKRAVPTELEALQPTDAYTLARDVSVRPDVVEPFHQLMEEARVAGYTTWIVNSGFRTIDEQRGLVADYGGAYAQRPSRSEHHTGLALDVGTTRGDIGELPEGTWLAEHVSAHGFIIRYPAHKTEVTGIAYEPWHIRYVGLPHSTIMATYDWTLEEYVDYVAAEEVVRFGNYTIRSFSRRAYDKWQSEREASSFTASADGTGRVIVTEWNGEAS